MNDDGRAQLAQVHASTMEHEEGHAEDNGAEEASDCAEATTTECTKDETCGCGCNSRNNVDINIDFDVNVA